ncbi:hypothetical protein GCM10023340_09660 [Nocardioides marinquilinus]|uniref:Aminoglycoside phosphotransferase domain-containing protein n=1 Tax=Nocardioides marinquilinus TaxID=1210400 RepID=A0ABP9PB03_9ACTN
MLRGVLPDDVLDDVARAVDGEVTVVGRLAGGANGGVVRVRVAGRPDAVLKTTPRTGSHQLAEALRARRVVEHMRARGYPTPAWLGVGATPTHVWQLVDHVDAQPATRLTPSLVEQLVTINELQAGQAGEPPDHWTYAWRVVTGREPVGAACTGHSPAAAGLVSRAQAAGAALEPPVAAPDMVHADLNPGNVLTRDGDVVALVDIGNAGRGTRATDLVTLLWHTFDEPLDDVRARLWTTVLQLVGAEWAAGLAATQALLQLEWRIGLARDRATGATGATEAAEAAVTAVIDRGHRVLDELDARR